MLESGRCPLGGILTKGLSHEMKTESQNNFLSLIDEEIAISVHFPQFQWGIGVQVDVYLVVDYASVG